MVNSKNASLRITAVVCSSTNLSVAYSSVSMPPHAFEASSISCNTYLTCRSEPLDA